MLFISQKKIKVCIVYKDDIRHLVGPKKVKVCYGFFSCKLVWFGIIQSQVPKIDLWDIFFHSFFVTEPKFSISIEKRWQTWIFSEFHKSILKCLFFQLFWLKLNHFHCNLSSFNGYSAHLVFSVALKSFKMLEIWRKSGMIVADLPNYLVSLA